MVVQAALASAVQPVAAGLADGLAPAGVLVVGSHITDGLVESNRIVFRSQSCQFAIKCSGIGDGLQVRPLAFDVAEERRDPGLIGGTPGRPWCWAMAISAMNARVASAVIGGPLSLPAAPANPTERM